MAKQKPKVKAVRCGRCDRLIDGPAYGVRYRPLGLIAYHLCQRCGEQYNDGPNLRLAFRPFGLSAAGGRWRFPKRRTPAWVMRLRGQRKHT